MRLLLRVVSFLIFCGVLYVGAVKVMGTIYVRGAPLLIRAYRGKVPGTDGQSLLHFREAQSTGPMDVIAFGSSHAQRSLDPRVFAEQGIRFYNYGSMSQAPLNSYYLYRHFAPQVHPHVVLIEVFWWTLDEDDTNVLESSTDLLSNLPLWPEMTEMALQSRRMEIYNLYTARRLGSMDPSGLTQQTIPVERYVPGGFVEYVKNRVSFAIRYDAQRPVNLDQRQLSYLARIIDDVHANGGTALLVLQPLPEAWHRAIPNATEVQSQLDQFARQHGSEYIDFGKRISLDAERHFYDSHHLNTEGAQLFTAEVIRALRERGAVKPAN